MTTMKAKTIGQLLTKAGLRRILLYSAEELFTRVP